MSSIESLFAKNKKKKKKANRSLELDDTGSKSRTSVDSKLTGEGSILGGDEGWVNDAGKKKTVYTGGKKVAELINMDELMTADEAAAERVYQEEQRREFTESRAAKEMQDKAQAEGKHVAGEDETKKTESKAPSERGLSGLAGISFSRIARRGINKRMVQLDVGNKEAFPSLGSQLPDQTIQSPAPSVWVGGLATATAKHDDSNDVGNQDGVIEKDEVDKEADAVQSETAPKPDMVQSETAQGPTDDPNPMVAKNPTSDGAVEEQLSSMDLLAKANKKIKKKKKDEGKI